MAYAMLWMQQGLGAEGTGAPRPGGRDALHGVQVQELQAANALARMPVNPENLRRRRDARPIEQCTAAMPQFEADAAEATTLAHQATTAARWTGLKGDDASFAATTSLSLPVRSISLARTLQQGGFWGLCLLCRRELALPSCCTLSPGPCDSIWSLAADGLVARPKREAHRESADELEAEE